MYRRCPQQWKLKYVDHLPEAPKPFFNLGTAVHSALEAFYRGRVAGPPPLDEVLAAFREAFDPDAYPTEEETERRRADGLAMTRAFYEKHAAGFRPALAVEKHLFFEVEGVAFTGYVDRIDKLGEARIGIVDYKTGGSFDLDRVKTEPQLTLYQLGTEQKLGHGGGPPGALPRPLADGLPGGTARRGAGGAGAGHGAGGGPRDRGRGLRAQAGPPLPLVRLPALLSGLRRRVPGELAAGAHAPGPHARRGGGAGGPVRGAEGAREGALAGAGRGEGAAGSVLRGHGRAGGLGVGLTG